MKYKVLKNFYFKTKTPQSHYVAGDNFPAENVSNMELEILLANEKGGPYVEEVKDYSEMKVNELKKELEKLGIEIPEKAKKADLIDLIEKR